ncbi:MAG: hypothetical protein CMM12_03240 [Rhodospirillaceae bacterium]|nr:hypothetical protein [Rhodospirillaceae bacterium]
MEKNIQLYINRKKIRPEGMMSRGYNVDPVTLMDAIETKEQQSIAVKDPVRLNNDVVADATVSDGRRREPVVQLDRIEECGGGSNRRIQPNSAYTVGFLIIAFVLVWAILDARSRVARLETLVYSILLSKPQS